MEFDYEELMEASPDLIIVYGTKIVLALLVYLIGKWVGKMLTNLLERGLNSRGIDPTVSQFTKNIVYYTIVAVVIVAALGQLGIQTASFVAIIGAAGLAVGLALQGSLSNFAAGVLLILFRPFKLGDYVDAGGASGTVKEISIFSTILQTPDNKIITVANSSVWGNNITNYSAEDERRVDFNVGVSYSANQDAVRSELLLIAEIDERVIQKRGITIGVLALAD
jgi:small conductance mechanosensitive channel